MQMRHATRNRDAPVRIAVVTTTRADYGIYRPLLEALRATGSAVELLVAGTHTVRRFGHTADQIAANGWADVHVIDHYVEADGGLDLAESAGRAVQGFARTLARCRPDLTFVLGDRYEMLSAGVAAAIMKIPLAHLHGGDLTEGAYDDQFRHALTKLSHLHFPALPEHAARIRAMGEEPWRVRTVGALAVDGLARFEPEPLQAIARDAGLDSAQPTLVLAYHTETLADVAPVHAFDHVIEGLRRFDGNVLVVGTNADEGHLGLSARMQTYARQRPRTALAPSLDQRRYWSWLRYATVLVGNSSSGLIEAPSLGLPAVNIGERQKGRVRAANVIDVPCEPAAIAAGLARALSGEFRQGLTGLQNPYGDGTAARRICDVLASLPPRDTLLRKRFCSA